MTSTSSISASSRQARGPLLAWGLWLVAVLILASILLLSAQPDSAALGETNLFVVVFLGTVAIYPTVGAAIAARRPDHYAGWLLLGTGLLFGFSILCVAIANAGAQLTPPPPIASWAGWFASWAFLTVIAGFGNIFLLHFPDGHLPDRRWRPVLVLVAASLGAYAIGTALNPIDVPTDYPGLMSPISVPATLAPAMQMLSDLGNLGLVVAIALAGASLVVRYRRAALTERLQIKWVAYVGIGLAVVFPVAAAQSGAASDIAFLLGFTLVAALPLAVAFAILRYRLYDIDRLISRTFVYGALTAFLAGMYAASLRLFQALFVAFSGNESDAALVLTTLVLATTLTPMKARLEGVAGRHLADQTAAGDAAEPPAARPFSLDDPASVADLEALIERVVQRGREAS